jgi:proteic killer suppression protein
MIKTVATKETRLFLEGKRVRKFQSFEAQARRRLNVLNNAICKEDLMRLPSNRFEALRGDRKGQYSIAINMQWRICFYWDDENGDARNVEITDYH